MDISYDCVLATSTMIARPCQDGRSVTASVLWWNCSLFLVHFTPPRTLHVCYTLQYSCFGNLTSKTKQYVQIK